MGDRSITVSERNASGAKLWNDAAVRSAISRQMTGDFSATADLARSMHTDPAYHAAIRKRVDGLIRNELTLRPDNEEDQSQLDAVEFAEPHLFTMLPETELAQLDQWFQDLEVAVATLDLQRRAEKTLLCSREAVPSWIVIS